ncbi:MAG: iron ABC transporter substrate-binding protein [Caldilineaceae bacterium]|nr:iron ABC transporter substrate-binding protein [Caldilineaceae bacterium]
MQHVTRRWTLALAALIISLIAACQPIQPATPEAAAPSTEGSTIGSLVVYSGRSENLVGPLITKFSEATGIQVDVRYAGTSEMAATLLEEGANSPADIFFSQDGGALGELSKAGLLAPLPATVLDQVPVTLQGQNGDWVGISGRARVLVYNNSELSEEDLPDDVWGLTEEKWRGRVGWAPTNASFQTFVTAMRVSEGDERTLEWLEAMVANDVQSYDGNAIIVESVAAGEISVGLTNHYYLYRFLAEQGESFSARNYYFRTPHAGSIINVAGAAILNTAKNPEAAEQFIEYLLSTEAQQFFADETFEYPLIAADIEVPDILLPLSKIATPDIQLNDLDDLAGTLELLQVSGALD